MVLCQTIYRENLTYPSLASADIRLKSSGTEGNGDHYLYNHSSPSLILLPISCKVTNGLWFGSLDSEHHISEQGAAMLVSDNEVQLSHQMLETRVTNCCKMRCLWENWHSIQWLQANDTSKHTACCQVWMLAQRPTHSCHFQHSHSVPYRSQC